MYAEVIRERQSIASTLLVSLAVLFAVLWFAAPATIPGAAVHTMTQHELTTVEGAGLGAGLGALLFVAGAITVGVAIAMVAAPATVSVVIAVALFNTTNVAAAATALGFLGGAECLGGFVATMMD